LPVTPAYSCAMQQKGGEELESVAPFEVVDHGSKLAVRAQWLSALKVRLDSHKPQTVQLPQLKPEL